MNLLIRNFLRGCFKRGDFDFRRGRNLEKTGAYTEYVRIFFKFLMKYEGKSPLLKQPLRGCFKPQVVLAMALFLSSSAWCSEAPSLQSYLKKPKLVVLIVIDQFRADYLTRFASKFLPPYQKREAGKSTEQVPGGFQYLMSRGAYFPFAHYDVLQNMTGPGHAMISTGAYPYRMGIPLNYWFESATGMPRYCASDPLKDRKEKAVSPGNLMADSFGDELRLAYPDSKVVTLALKDRAAIFMGGKHPSLAVWFDHKNFQWTSNAFYLKGNELPKWVQELNQALDQQRGQSYEWKPILRETNKTTTASVLRKAVIGEKEVLDYPFGVEMTTDAAIKAIQSMNLGKGSATDVLAVSYSTHDYLGHSLGPQAMEMEEMTLAEDRSLSRLFVVLENTFKKKTEEFVVVLTADHGIPYHPEYLKANGMEGGGVDAQKIMSEAEQILNEKIGKAKNGKWIAFEVDFNFYFSSEYQNETKLRQKEIEDILKSLLVKNQSIYSAFTKTEVYERRLPPGVFEGQILRSYVPGRSGDVIAIPKPGFVSGGGPVDHMTSYSYDRSVPILFLGAAFRPGVYAESPDVIQIAPTLTHLLGVLPPNQSEGKVLSQIFRDH